MQLSIRSFHPPSSLDVAPEAWGDFAGHLLVADWGDLSPPTNPLRGEKPSGFQVVGAAIEKIRDERPGQFSLFQNCPNPINTVTRIQFDLAAQASVTVRVYDSAGREVSTLVDETLAPGTYMAQWSAMDRRWTASRKRHLLR